MEVRVVRDFKDLLYEQVDPLKIIQHLRKHLALEDSEKKVLFSLSTIDRKKAWQRLLPLLEKKCIIQHFFRSLLDCSYTDLFLQMTVQLKCIQNTSAIGIPTIVTKCESLLESRRFSQHLFIDMKIKTHNISIGNPREYLHKQSELYKLEFDSESDEYAKMIKADRLASSLCAEIDAHTMLYDHRFPTHGLFKKLKNLIPHTSNTSVTQVAYDARMAIAYAIARQGDKGDEHIRNAMGESLNIEPCVELVNMLYIHVFNLICIFENTPTSQTLEKIVRTAEHSMNCLSEEKCDFIRVFWARMFYLRMVFCLIGISNKCDVIPGYTVHPKHKQKAKNLLTEVDKIWNGIESRRKMFYYVAQARVAELENTTEDLEFAILHINEAVDIGVKGAFGELDSIKKYSCDLTDRLSTLSNLEVAITTRSSKRTEMQHESPEKQFVSKPEKAAVEYSSSIETNEKVVFGSWYLPLMKENKFTINDNSESYEVQELAGIPKDTQVKERECTIENNDEMSKLNYEHNHHNPNQRLGVTAKSHQELQLETSNFICINRPSDVLSETLISEPTNMQKDNPSSVSFDSTLFRSLSVNFEQEHDSIGQVSISLRRPNYFS